MNQKLVLQAFRWFLNATDQQVQDFADIVSTNPNLVFIEFRFAFDAIMAAGDVNE